MSEIRKYRLSLRHKTATDPNLVFEKITVLAYSAEDAVFQFEHENMGFSDVQQVEPEPQ